MLTTQFIDDPEVTKAVEELADNARRLVIAGRFTEAHEALRRVLLDGPWRAKAHGRLKQQLEQLVPVTCLLAGQPCPKIGDQPAMTAEETAQWGEEQGERVIDDLAMATRNQVNPAGEQWSEGYFEGLANVAERDQRLPAFGTFLRDAEFVLKARLAEGRPAKFFGMDVDEIEAALGEAAADPQLAAMMKQVLGSGDVTALARGASAGPEIAEAAQRIPTLRIARAAAEYLAATGDAQIYLVDFVYKAAAVLSVRDARPRDAAECAGHLLANGWMALQELVRLATWPPMAEAYRAGHFAAIVGVQPKDVPAYLLALEGRRHVAPAKRALPRRGPRDTLASFTAVATGSVPKSRALVELPILDSGESAYGYMLEIGEVEKCWRAARALLDKTGRWPVVTMFYGPGGGPAQEIDAEGIFSRFYYEEAPDSDDVSPRGLIAAADDVDLDGFIARKRAHDEERGWSLDEMIDFQLEATLRAVGKAPTANEVRKARLDGKPLTSDLELERWLLEWELANGGMRDPSEGRHAWFDGDESFALLFLPTAQPWDTLAYINMFGTSDYGSENYIAMGRRWHQRYGAELACHYGTMLQSFVTRPPTDPREAFALSAEHLLMAPCTFHTSGTTLRHHAAGLVGHDRWFFHERP